MRLRNRHRCCRLIEIAIIRNHLTPDFSVPLNLKSMHRYKFRSVYSIQEACSSISRENITLHPLEEIPLNTVASGNSTRIAFQGGQSRLKSCINKDACRREIRDEMTQIRGEVSSPRLIIRNCQDKHN